MGPTVSSYDRQTSSISRNKSQIEMFLVSSCSCFCPIHWSQVLSRERRCSWVINNFITYYGALMLEVST